MAAKDHNDSLKNHLFDEEWLVIPRKREIVVLDDVGEHLERKAGSGYLEYHPWRKKVG